MKKIILFLSFFFVLFNQSFSQDLDTTQVRGQCGYHPDVLTDTTGRLNKFGNPTVMSLPKSAYTNSLAIINCGKFRLYYEDIQIGSTGGFNAPAGVGANRRATICAVYTYIQSLFDFSNVTTADPICIEIQASTDPVISATACPSPTVPAYKILGIGAPLVNSLTTGIKNGSLLDHIITGTSPNINNFDATLFINFCGAGYSYYENATGAPGYCQWDLFTIALHEVGHEMGFCSFLKENGSLVPVSTYTVAPNIYSNFDWKFLWRGDITGSPVAMQKFIVGTISSPSLAASLNTANTLRDMKLWLNSNITPTSYSNIPLYSGIYYPSYPSISYGWSSGVTAPLSLVSHIDGDHLSFTQRFSKSPGFHKLFVMQPLSAQGRMMREFTEQEIRIFTALGYSLNATYGSTNTICSCATTNSVLLTSNRPPYTTKKITNIATSTNTDVTYPEVGQVADYTVNVGSSITISLSTLPSTLIADPDGDPIKIEPGSLYNIRGCGSSGNNHNCLTVNSSSNAITYTPRTNFFGRAQFGFYLHDGKERGSYMIFTIDVISTASFTNTPNVNTPAARPELVLNGDFEEGIEVKRNINTTEEAINGGEQRHNWEEGKYYQGVLFNDAHPFEYVKNAGWSNNFGTVIGQSAQACSINFPPIGSATIFYQYGSGPFHWPQVFPGNPAPTSGIRYSSVIGGYNYYSLSSPLQKCKYYTLKMDIINSSLVVGNTYTFSFQCESSFSYPTTTSLQTKVVTFTRTAGWQTITFPFWYCSSTNANYINLISGFPNVTFNIDNVSVTEDTSPPPLTVSVTPWVSIVCVGSNTVTLNAIVSNSACSNTFTWNPGNLSGQTVTVAPTSGVTNYTVTVNDGCRSATSPTPGARVEVGNNTPLPVITASSNSVCIGQTFTLTSTGGTQTSYTWSPGSYTINPVTYTQSATSIYTVQTMLAGCTLGSSATYTVNTGPTWTVTSNPPSGLCPGYSTATLTAFGTAVSYTWSTGANTNSIAVSPTVTTVYTVSGTDAGGCVSSTTYSLFVSPTCTCNSQNGTIITSTVIAGANFNGGSYAINSNILFTGYATFANVDLQVGPGVTFSVAPNATLNIGNSHIYSCFDMWDGIRLSPTANIIVNNGSLIEDAGVAIRSSSSTITSGSVISVSSTVFNRNNVAIWIENYTPSVTTYPFYIWQNVFTSRSLTFTPSSWPQQSLLSQTVAPANPLGSPYPLQNFPVITLKSPNTTLYPLSGITCLTVGATSNPSTTATYTSIQIGLQTNTLFVNIFDNQYVGVSLVDANAKVWNNIFQNSQYQQPRGNYLYGIGVDHYCSDGSNNYLSLKSPAPNTTTKKNKFYDCTYAVRTNNVFELDAQYMVVQSTQSASSSYQRGKYGVYSTSNRFRQYDVQNNLIYNIENGITFNSTYGGITFGASTYTNTQYSGLVYLNLNTIAPVASGTIGTEFVSNAVTAMNVLSSGSTNSLTSNSQVNASGNIMTKVYRGINASNFYTPAFMSQNNTCTLTLDPGNNLQQGIAITTCSNASVQTNVIVGPSTTNTITTGIYASMNNTPKITCNTVSITYQGFELNGQQPGTKWKGNSLTTHSVGMALTSGTIGAQGSASNPIDNTWNTPSYWIGTKYHTYTSASTATDSPLYVQNSAIYTPTNNWGFPSTTSYLAAGATNTTTGAYSCAGGGARLMGNINDDYEASYIELLEKIAGSNANLNNKFDVNTFIAQCQLYKVLEFNSDLKSKSSVLNSFYMNNKLTEYGKIQDGHSNLISGNYSSAINSLNSIASKNNVETNYSNFYNLYSKYYSNSFTDGDNATLLTLANKCPVLEGEVIYEARALYNIVNSTVALFKDNCPDKNSIGSRLANNVSTTNSWAANIYPVPAYNELFIGTNVAQENVNILITDVNGRVVYENSVRTNNSVGNIKLDLSSGIYFVNLSNDNNDKVVKKLVIAK